MTFMNIQPFIDIVEDLNLELSPAERYRRMIDALARAVPCDAIVLLQLQGDELRPLAQRGLLPEAMARRFLLDQHPRLQQILMSHQPVRFAADSNLPDPYDGLVADSQQLHVHDCMGWSIRLNERAWGVLTLDAMQAGSFDRLQITAIRACMAAVTAAVRASQQIQQLQDQAEHQHQVVQLLMAERSELIGRSPAMKAIEQEIATVAPSELSVLITGETGVGKELVARRIHQLSPRQDEALVQINCAALPESIIESELFGHVRGAFSGATADRSGRFELADGGTLFLDEVGELPLAAQAKLLRALQSGEIQRVGSDRLISVDVRLVAATNRDLQQEVREGRFRADLYHRLSVYPLPVPPLRQRDDDVLLLAGYFLERNQQRLCVQRLRLSQEAARQLQHWHWPGNVRELEHLLSRAALRASHGQDRRQRVLTIEAMHLGLQPAEAHLAPELLPEFLPELLAGGALPRVDLRQATDQFQRQLIDQQISAARGNIAAAARALGLDRSNLMRTMKRLGMR